MKRRLDQWIAGLWNRFRRTPNERREQAGLDLGKRVNEDDARGRVTIPQARRTQSVAILGRSGTGKSSCMRYLAKQDIEASRGFLYFDIHGDATSFLLASIAEREQELDRDLSDRVIVIEPGDAEYSVGMNPLERESGAARFVQIAEFASVLKERWHLDSFGARTDELLRNSLYTLAEANLTLLELGLLLTHPAFRSACVKQVSNPEVREYFTSRYDGLSEAMQATMREPILNKTSAFTADPHFRHIVGQTRSTFSLLEAMDAGRWVVLNLDKGRLGAESPTLGALFFTGITNALFARAERRLFTIYVDEIQNLVENGNRVDTVLSEARKFGVGICSANQFLEQYPPAMRAAILAVGTHVFFQLSAADAVQIANALDGGHPLAERLKNLPARHMIVKTGTAPFEEAVVPTVRAPKADGDGLYLRSRMKWARKRSDVERDISDRQSVATRNGKESLDDWE